MAEYNEAVFINNIRGVPFQGQGSNKGKTIRFVKTNMHGNRSVMFVDDNEERGGGKGVHYSIPRKIDNFSGAHHTNERRNKPANRPKHRYYQGKWLPKKTVRRMFPEAKPFRNRVVTDPDEIKLVLLEYPNTTIGTGYVQNFKYIKAALDRRQKEINNKQKRIESNKRRASFERRRKVVNNSLIRQARSESRKRKASSERRRKAEERRQQESDNARLNQERLERIKKNKNENIATVAALKKELVSLEKELGTLRKKEQKGKIKKNVEKARLSTLARNIPAKEREINRKQQKINQNNYK